MLSKEKGNQLSSEIEDMIKKEGARLYPVTDRQTYFAVNGHHTGWDYSNASLIEKNERAAYIAGATKWALESEYWKKRCEAAESLISVMNVPKNKADGHNDGFILFGERNQEWQKSKSR